jgi:hypothetical protein
MRTTPFLKIFVILILFMVGIPIILLSQNTSTTYVTSNDTSHEASIPIATVQIVEGNGIIHRGEQEFALQSQEPIHSGDRIQLESNSYLKIATNDSSIQALPETVFTISKTQETWHLTINSGALLYFPKKPIQMDITFNSFHNHHIESPYGCLYVESTKVTVFSGTIIDDLEALDKNTITYGSCITYTTKENHIIAMQQHLAIPDLMNLWETVQMYFKPDDRCTYPYLYEIGQRYELQKEINYLDTLIEHAPQYSAGIVLENLLEDARSKKHVMQQTLIGYDQTINQGNLPASQNQSALIGDQSRVVSAGEPDSAVSMDSTQDESDLLALNSVLYLIAFRGLYRTEDGAHWDRVNLGEEDYWATDITSYRGQYYAGIVAGWPPHCIGLGISKNGVDWDLLDSYDTNLPSPNHFHHLFGKLFIIGAAEDWLNFGTDCRGGVASTEDGHVFVQDIHPQKLANTQENMDIYTLPSQVDDTSYFDMVSPARIGEHTYILSGNTLWTMKEDLTWERVVFDSTPNFSTIKRATFFATHMIHFKEQYYLLYDQHTLFISENGTHFKKIMELDSGGYPAHFSPLIPSF